MFFGLCVFENVVCMCMFSVVVFGVRVYVMFIFEGVDDDDIWY